MRPTHRSFLGFATIVAYFGGLSPLSGAYAATSQLEDHRFVANVLYQDCLRCGASRSEALAFSKRMSLKPADPLVQALLMINQGNFEQALSHLPPGANASVDLSLLRADCLAELGKHDEERALYKELKKAKSSDSNVYLRSSIANTRAKDFKSALEDIHTAKKLKLRSAALLHEAEGDLAFAERNYNRALECFNVAIWAEPTYAYPHERSGQCLLRLHKTDPAIVRCSEAVRLEPTNAFRHAMLGVCLKGKGKYKSSLAEFKRALEIMPSYLRLHEYEGDCYLHLGNWQAAVTQYMLAPKSTRRGENNRLLPTNNECNLRKAELVVTAYRQTPHTKSCIATALRAIALLPESLSQDLCNHGVSIVVAPTVRMFVEANGGYARHGGCGALEDLAGLYLQGPKKVVIGENAVNQLTRVPAAGAKLVLHELGHAYDYTHGLLSDDVQFKLCYARDCASLTPGQREAHSDDLRHGLHGCEQLFADLFSEYYVRVSAAEASSSSEYQKAFPSSYRYLVQLVPTADGRK